MFEKIYKKIFVNVKIRLNLIQLTKTFINKSFAIEIYADLIDENFLIL